MRTFDQDEATAMCIRMHEIVVEDAGPLFVVHDLNPRAMSPRVQGFVPAQSWMQDLVTIKHCADIGASGRAYIERARNEDAAPILFHSEQENVFRIK
jgi:hypothetical protein